MRVSSEAVSRRNALQTLLGVPLLASGETKSTPLYLMTYDHGGLVLWGIEHFEERLRDAVSWLDRYPGFKIGVENEAYTYDYLAKRDPKVLVEIRRLLKRYQGRFGIGSCSYGQPLSTYINEESNIRQIGFALESTRTHFGHRPRVYMMSEHAMHCQIPQLLKGFGFTHAIMRTHYMMYGYNPTYNVPSGWWTGPDGSRIPTLPTYAGEGAEFGRTTVDNWMLTRCPGPDCRGGSLQAYRKQFEQIVPLVATRDDDSGLRREDLVKETEGSAEYRWILLEDLPGVLPEPKAVFNTRPDDFTTRMPWGYCGNEIWNRCREAEAAVLTAERLNALALLAGGESSRTALDEAWKGLLVAQHHDIQICGLVADAQRFLTPAIETARNITGEAVRQVASRMQVGSPVQVTVFNPLSWRRPGWVEVDVSLPSPSKRDIQIRLDGAIVPSTVISAQRSSGEAIQEAHVAFLADAPPLGFASYEIVPDAGPTSEPSAVVPYWAMEFDPHGGIASITCRKTGRKVASGIRFAAMVDGKPCESSGVVRALPSPAGAQWATTREDGTIGGIPYRLFVTAWTDSPRIDFKVSFEFDGQKLGTVSDNKRDARSPFIHETKLRLKAFPALGPHVTGVRDLPFIVAETDHRYVDGNYWTALASDQGGLAFFNRGTMNAVREEDGSFSLPLAYSMHYVWGTRWLSGEYGYEFALQPFLGKWGDEDLHRRALEYNFPSVAVTTETEAGNDPKSSMLGHRWAPFRLDGKNAIVSALYEDAGRIHMRVYEHRGDSGALSLQWGDGAPATLIETDLLNTPLGAISSPVELTPWQIRTFSVHRSK